MRIRASDEPPRSVAEMLGLEIPLEAFLCLIERALRQVFGLDEFDDEAGCLDAWMERDE